MANSRVKKISTLDHYWTRPQRPDRIWGPLSLKSNEYRGLSSGGQVPERFVNHSRPASAEDKNSWSYINPLPLLIKHRERFYFYIHKHSLSLRSVK
jgi:hypothetical protein